MLGQALLNLVCRTGNMPAAPPSEAVHLRAKLSPQAFQSMGVASAELGLS